MGGFALVGLGLFVASSLVVGARLLWLAWRTRELPEFAIGVALVAGGGISYLLLVSAFALRAFPPAYTPFAMILGNFFGSLGAASLALAVRHIFRPHERWAQQLQLGLTTVLAVSIAARLGDPGALPSPGYVLWPQMTAGAVCYGWCALESLRWYGLARRRARIGLVETEVAQRFGLWGMAGLAAAGIHVATLVNRLIDPSSLHPTVIVVQTALGLVSAVGVWMAFAPRLRARQGAEAQPAAPV